MKKAIITLMVLAFALSLVAVAFAATMTGTIKGVNLKAGTIMFCPSNTSKNETLKAGSGLNLSSVKTGKATLTVNKGVVTAVTPMKAPRKLIEGC
ncbi:MAG: hypothetical protein M0Z58_06380 [Nitrospiraceae bacterium]|nr:hypothetical protein [Nitrospiraceae bacterium]